MGEYVEQVKIAALRTATGRAEPLVDAVADLITRYMESTGNPIVDAASRTFETSTGLCFKARRDARKLADCITAARALDQALTASRPNVFAELKAAHGKLAAQLAGRDVSFDDAVAAISRFARKADELWRSVQQLQKALSPPAES